MGTLVAGAPLLAGGPPGWLVYAGLAVGTLVIGGALYMSSSRTDTRAGDRAIPTTADCIPCRQWTVRTHAQGTDMGGTSGSTLGAPPVTLSVPIPALTGAANAHTTFALLTQTQASVREDAFARALRWLSECPRSGGYLGKKSFDATDRRGGKRFDIDSFGPSNNFVS